MLPIKNRIELVVKSLGRGIFILKLTAIQARSQVPRSLSVAVPRAKPSHSPAWPHRPAKLSRRQQTEAMLRPLSPQQKDIIRTLREFLRWRSKAVCHRISAACAGGVCGSTHDAPVTVG